MSFDHWCVARRAAAFICARFATGCRSLLTRDIISITLCSSNECLGDPYRALCELCVGDSTVSTEQKTYFLQSARCTNMYYFFHCWRTDFSRVLQNFWNAHIHAIACACRTGFCSVKMGAHSSSVCALDHHHHACCERLQRQRKI